jgi:pheromone shutdown-related protein TraB
MFEKDKIDKDEIKDLMKGQDMFNEVMGVFAEKLPKVKQVFIDERDMFIANKIVTAPGKKILAVVGKGHLKGIERDILKKAVYNPEIEKLPKPSMLPKLIPWFIFGLIAVIIVIGFFKGSDIGLSMLWAWVIASGTSTAIFAAAALAHPLTILASYVAAPIKLIVPTISAGMVLAPLEAFLRKPTVKDFESLNTDMLTFKGFFKNRVLKVLVVFIGATVGAIIGHTIAIIWIARLLAK